MVAVLHTGKGYASEENTPKNLLPEKYSTPKTTPLKVTIKEGTNDVKLEVTTK